MDSLEMTISCFIKWSKNGKTNLGCNQFQNKFCLLLQEILVKWLNCWFDFVSWKRKSKQLKMFNLTFRSKVVGCAKVFIVDLFDCIREKRKISVALRLPIGIYLHFTFTAGGSVDVSICMCYFVQFDVDFIAIHGSECLWCQQTW